jgi:glycosyltransferase involved in cell wall biosynthesis
MQTPRTVAVLIPFYYAERLDWLEAAINSVHRQQAHTIHTLRIYLGIDGPMHSDITTFLKRHEQKLYKVVHNPVNQGLAVILNRMIDALQNEDYIARLDADDLALPNRFQQQIDFMEAQPHIHVSGGAIIESDLQPNGYRQTITYPLTHEEIAQNWFKRNAIAHPTSCVRATIYQQGHRYPVDALYNEDLGMWLNLMKSGYHFANLPEVLIEFRITSSFYKRRGYVMALVEFKLYLRAIQELQYSKTKYFWPLLRFLFRLAPTWIKKVGYRSHLRRYL